jgi:hypothetical protein
MIERKLDWKSILPPDHFVNQFPMTKEVWNPYLMPRFVGPHSSVHLPAAVMAS